MVYRVWTERTYLFILDRDFKKYIFSVINISTIISYYTYFIMYTYSNGQNYITFQFFEHNFYQNASNALKIL